MTPDEDRVPELVDRVSKWLEHSQELGRAYVVRVLGHDLVVLPGVFSPKYFSETEFYTREVLARLNAGDRYLDLGCGAGLTAVMAGEKGAEVLALDINPAAVDNCRLNSHRLGLEARVEVRESDVFDAIDPGERFDLIYWNIPFVYREPDEPISTLEESVFDPDYEKHARYLRDAPNLVAPGGTVLLGWSSTLGDEERLSAVARVAGVRLDLQAHSVEADTGESLELLAVHRIER